MSNRQRSTAIALPVRSLNSIIMEVLNNCHTPKLTGELLDEVKSAMSPEERVTYAAAMFDEGLRSRMGAPLTTNLISIAGELVPLFISFDMGATLEKQRVLFTSATIRQVNLWLDQRRRDKRKKDKAHRRVTASVEKLLAAIPARATQSDCLFSFFEAAE